MRKRRTSNFIMQLDSGHEHHDQNDEELHTEISAFEVNYAFIICNCIHNQHFYYYEDDDKLILVRCKLPYQHHNGS